MVEVTKFTYPKNLLEPNVTVGIAGLPFLNQEYKRAKNLLRNGYGKMSQIVNCIPPKYNGVTSNQFYESHLFDAQALKMLGKLKEVNGYVQMLSNILPGIRGDLIRTNENWQECNFPKLVYAPRDGQNKMLYPSDQVTSSGATQMHLTLIQATHVLVPAFTGEKGKLTNAMIDKLQNYYGIAIHSNVGDLNGMKKAIHASFFQCASSEQHDLHTHCPTEP